MIPQAAVALPEVRVASDGTIAVDGHSDATPVARFDADAHAGLLAFLEAAAALDVDPPRVKIQCTGPLTLGVALTEAGMPVERAFRRAAEATGAWVEALEDLVRARLPASSVVLFLDEPGLVGWRTDDGPIGRDAAVDLLSGVLAGVEATSGVHVCSGGDHRLALEAGPQVVGIDLESDVASDADALTRYLDGDGWIAWGVVRADRPIGSSSEPLWRSLVEVWCELTRRGCDPVRLRTQSLITPTCGLAGHSVGQAERLLSLTNAIAERVHGQAVAARLTLGA